MSTTIAGTPLASVNGPDGLRAHLARPGGQAALGGLMTQANVTLVSSRHHWLLFDGEWRGRKELRDLLTPMAARPVADWTAPEAELLLCLVALRRAGMGLEQVDRQLTAGTVREVLAERLGSYLDALGHPRPLHHLAILELADRVAELRAQIERDHHRYSIIDGRRWYRREGLITRRSVRTGPLPPQIVAALRPFSPGTPTSLDVPEYLAAVTRDCLARRGRTAELVDVLLEAAVADPSLRVDHATVTCARGVLLDCPASLSASSEFFTRTAMARGIELADHAEQLGHASEERLRATLKARMIKLKRKAVENYYGDTPLCGEWVEKAADNMVFHNEDSHYRGHRSVGVSTGGRAAFSVGYVRGGVPHVLPPMMGDFRVVRFSRAVGDRFTGDGLVDVIRYARWTRCVVQETFRAGGVLEVLDSDSGSGSGSGSRGGGVVGGSGAVR
ncbi:hypothetical protein ACFW9L_07735 [Streptomyces sp. NPDC059517]|uniref:hypothetical protein n=1 Tax=Streptomyces sp. NPDC059517 TaxID=3346855 RepID=UPI0036B7AB50